LVAEGGYVKLLSKGSDAAKAGEPCQVGNEAAINRYFRVQAGLPLGDFTEQFLAANLVECGARSVFITSVIHNET